jgi:hypothetical protein
LCKAARADRVWPVDRPRGAAGLVVHGGAGGPRDRARVHRSTVDRGARRGSRAAAAWSAAAVPWPRQRGPSRRRCRAWGASPRAWARRVGRGECVARVGRAVEGPGRARAAAGFGRGAACSGERERKRKRERERKGNGRGRHLAANAEGRSSSSEMGSGRRSPTAGGARAVAMVAALLGF